MSDNLIPVTQRSKEEARELSVRGGIASGEARREKKRMKEWAQIFGALPAKVVTNDGQEISTDNLGAIMAAQIEKARRGDTKAAKFVAAVLGELEQTVTLNTDEGGIRIIDTRKANGLESK